MNEFENAWGALCSSAANGVPRVSVLDDVTVDARSAPNGKPERVIYTDGSYDPKRKNALAGWAVVAFDETRSERRLS